MAIPEEINDAAFLTTRLQRIGPYRELQLAVAHALPALKWRLHPSGILQAYLAEGGEPEVRAHIWHPSLMRPGNMDEGQTHNHRFSFHSRVLLGRLWHEEWVLRDADDGAYQRFAVTNCRSGSAPPVPVGRRCNAFKMKAAIGAGTAYNFIRGAFHCAWTDELTVTLVSKYDQHDEPAHIVVPAGTTPRHGFEEANPHLDALISKYVGAAYDALLLA